MLSSKKLFLIAASSLLFFIPECYAQMPEDQLAIKEADSREQMLLNTAKQVGNIVIAEIETLYGLPESLDKLKGDEWTSQRRSARESALRRSFARRLAGQKNFIAFKKNEESKTKGYVIENKKVTVHVTIASGVVPAVTINAYDCKESGHSELARVYIHYAGKHTKEWSIDSQETRSFQSVSGASPPKCFVPELLELDKKYEKVDHGDHYHYVPKNRDPDIPIGRFPTEPPEEGEYITPSGEVVEKEQ